MGADNNRTIDNKLVLGLLIVGVFILIVIGAKSKRYSGNNSGSDSQEEQVENNSDELNGIVDDKATEEMEIAANESKEKAIVESELLSQQAQDAKEIMDSIQDTDMDIKFGIRALTEENYANNLDYTQYLYGHTDIPEFSFYYATNLYNNVTMNQKYEQTEYGMNVRTIQFTGSKGSTLSYSLNERDDRFSIQEMIDYIHNRLWSLYTEPEDIIFSAKEDGGKIIVTGWDSAAHNLAIYDLIMVNQDYVMEMKVTFPDYTGNDDKLQKTYVTECYYRMCGFSGSSQNPRSYAEFLEANQ